MATPTSKIYYVWINALTANYSESIVGRLIRRNWHVAALGNQLVLQSDDKPSSLIAFSVTKTPKEGEEITCASVLDEVKDVIKLLKVSYYSLIVTESAHCTWTLGNISIEDAQKHDEATRKGLN